MSWNSLPDGVGADIQSIALASLFVGAVNERVDAVEEMLGVNSLLESFRLTTPAIGDRVDQFYTSVLASIDGLQQYFVPVKGSNYDGDPANPGPSGFGTDSAFAYFGSPALPRIPITFTYAREILTTNPASSPGVEGQVARYVGGIDGIRGALYKFHAGSWVLDTTDHDPDHITTTTSTGYLAGLTGAYIFGSFLNQLRDALNQLVWCWTNNFTSAGMAGTETDQSGRGSTTSDTLSDLAGATPTTFAGGLSRTLNDYGSTDGVNVTGVNRSTVNLKYTLHAATGKNRNVRWLVLPVSVFDADENMGDFATAFGHWILKQTDSSINPSSNSTLAGPDCLCGSGRLSTASVAPTPGFNQSFGYGQDFGMIFQYDVAGGFTYSALSP